MFVRTCLLGLAIVVGTAITAVADEVRETDGRQAVFAAMGNDKALFWKIDSSGTTLVWHRRGAEGWTVSVRGPLDRSRFDPKIRPRDFADDGRGSVERFLTSEGTTGFALKLQYGTSVDRSIVEQFKAISLGSRHAAVEEVKAEPWREKIHVGGKDIVWWDAPKLPIDQCNQAAMAAVPLPFDVDVVGGLARQRKLTDPRVVPYLIRGLESGNVHDALSCFDILCKLTRHTSGEDRRSKVFFQDDPTKYADIARWWRGWWESNKDKHPIFDTELESRARKEMWRLSEVVREVVQPLDPKFLMSERPSGSNNPLLSLAYQRVFLATTMREELERLPWVEITCAFQTPDLASAEGPAKRDEIHNSLMFHLGAAKQRLYRREIPGTDLVIEVVAAAKNEAVLRQLARALEAEENKPAVGAAPFPPGASKSVDPLVESHDGRLLTYKLTTDRSGASTGAWVLLRAEPEKQLPVGPGVPGSPRPQAASLPGSRWTVYTDIDGDSVFDIMVKVGPNLDESYILCRNAWIQVGNRKAKFTAGDEVSAVADGKSYVFKGRAWELRDVPRPHKVRTNP